MTLLVLCSISMQPQRWGKNMLSSLYIASACCRSIKYVIIFLSALVLEVGSTMYISSVSDKMVGSTMFWAFVGPFIALPFAGFVADEKTWKGRLFLALSSSVGYTLGALLSMYFIMSK